MSKPKGVMLTHKSIISNILGANELVKEIEVKDHKFLSIIPLSHAYEHTGGFLLPMHIGAEIFFNKDRDEGTLHPVLDEVVDNWRELNDDEQKEDFRLKILSYTRLYGYLSQIINFKDIELEKICSFTLSFRNDVPVSYTHLTLPTKA